MKKKFALVCAFLMVLALAGCGGTDSSSASTAVSTVSSASQAGAESQEGESATPTLDAIKEKGVFTLMTATGFPPFEYLGADGQPAGVDIDVGQMIADELGVEYEVLDMDFNLLVEALKSGKGDMIGAAMTVTPERAEQVDFTDTYATAGQVLLLPADSEITDVEQLKSGEYTVTVQATTTGDIYAQEELGLTDLLQFKNAVECASALANGKADTAVLDNVAAASLVKTYDGQLKMLEEMVTQEDYALAVAKGHEDLVELANQVIAENADDIAQSMTEHEAAASEE